MGMSQVSHNDDAQLMIKLFAATFIPQISESSILEVNAVNLKQE